MPRKTKTTRKAGKAVEPKEDNRGRKPSLSDEARKELIDCLMLGNSQITAFTLAGLPRSTYYDWLKWGEAAIVKREKGEELTENEKFYSDFSDDIKKAIERGKKRHMAIINQAAQGGVLIKESQYVDKNGDIYKIEKTYSQPNWQASGWTLERRYPDEFGRRESVSVDQKSEVKHSGSIDAGITAEELAVLKSVLRTELDRRRALVRTGQNGENGGISPDKAH